VSTTRQFKQTGLLRQHQSLTRTGETMTDKQEMIQAMNAELNENALIINKNITFDEWEAIGQQLGAMGKGLMFWIGDWLTYGEQAFADKYSQAMDITGYSYRTVRQAKYIATKFTPEMRKSNLTFTHYTAVAGEEQEVAVRLLNDASNQNMTVDELKEHRKGQHHPVDQNQLASPGSTKHTVTCPHCNETFEIELE